MSPGRNQLFLARWGLKGHNYDMEDRIRRQTNQADKSIFDDGEALIALATASFKKAAKAAVAENDRLGIATHGSVDGKIVEHKPPAARHIRLADQR